MQKRINVCDRCKKEVKQVWNFCNSSEGGVYDRSFNLLSMIYTFDFDLCRKCKNEFKKQLKEFMNYDKLKGGVK